MIEYRYGILSQLISEIDNYYQKKRLPSFKKKHWIWLNKILVGISKFIILDLLQTMVSGSHL